MTVNKEQAIKILANFGFKVYNRGKEQYFLQSATKVKPMTKYSMDKMLELLNPETKSVVDKVKEVVAPKVEEPVDKPKPKKKTVKKEVKKDE